MIEYVRIRKLYLIWRFLYYLFKEEEGRKESTRYISLEEKKESGVYNFRLLVRLIKE